MIITCPNCNFRKDTGDDSFQPAGMLATCPFCNYQFEVASGTPRYSFARLSIAIVVPAIALWCGFILFTHDWKLDKNYFLQPGFWQGEMTYLGRKHPFELVIDKAQDGYLSGYMDWVEYSPRYRLAIRGTYIGNHLRFEDFAFLERESAAGLFDEQDVHIIENEMIGTAKNGRADFHAIKRGPPP